MSMKNINLSEWALKNQSLVKYFLVVLFIAGFWGYLDLNKREDPDFTIKTMMVKVVWPGATESQIENQVVDKLEVKLMELSTLDYISSEIHPGYANLTINLQDTTRGQAISDSWYQVRKKISDIKDTLPAGVQGPYFNDEFGDTYSNIFAFQSSGYNYEELRQIAEDVKREILSLEGVSKVDLMGVQKEQIDITLSSAKISAQGVSLNQVVDAIKNQNMVQPSGKFTTKDFDIPLRVTGTFENIEQIRNLPIAIDSKVFRLGDLSDIKRNFVNPPQTKINYQGSPTILLGVVLDKSADIVHTGEKIEQKYAEIKNKLPVGIEDHLVTNQPDVVLDSVNEFLHGLFEAVIIVLAVSFVSLGWRTGIVVAISIPLVLSVTFLVMKMYNIDLQRISLGALVISLGLLVDDAIIAVEMMVLKLEEGYDKFKAATYAYTSTAFPMLSGTLITVAGFLPVGMNSSTTGEYVFSLFAVVGISLIVSWVVAVIFTPYLGFKLLPAEKFKQMAQAHGHINIFDKPFYRKLKHLLALIIEYKRLVVLGTVGIFILSLALFKLLVSQQFFPSSDRPEILVDMWLPQSASIYNTETQAKAFESYVMAQKGVENVTTFIGSGAPRFLLSLNVQQQNKNFAQLLIKTEGGKTRDELVKNLQGELLKHYPDVRGRVNLLQLGPPVDYPVQFRVSGSDPSVAMNIALNVESIMRANPQVKDVSLDWGEDMKSIRVDVDQSKAKEVGISSQSLETQLNMLLTGSTLSYYFDKDQTIPLIARLEDSERDFVNGLPNLMIQNSSGKYIPVSQVAKITYQPEASLKYRRNRVPTITVRSDVVDGAQGNDVTLQIFPKLKELEKSLPLGYHIEYGGSLESSAKAQSAINSVYPVMLIIILTLLMLQLKSFKRSLLVIATAPLGMIGVSLSLIILHAPFGFVALLGVIALLGIIMRNSVILIDQIEKDISHGETPYEAVQMSVLRRFRPIVLTAAAAILGMIPLVRSVFWGPMAVAMMGGLFIATLLTLMFLPALYAWVFKVSKHNDKVFI